jgi:hypothetical protein
MKIPRFFIFLLFLAITALSAHAQVDTGRAASAVDSIPRTDSTRPQSFFADTAAFVMTKSPVTAVICSIIPGGGQLYNEQYWKVPLFAGAAGYFIWRVIYYNDLFQKKAAEAAVHPPTSSMYSSLKQQRESYRDARDLNAAYVLGIELLGMIDAYVGAHMFDFTVGEGVSSRIYLTPDRPGMGFYMRW